MHQTTKHNPWLEQFARERERLLAALGEMTEGGIVEQLEHVGSTSIPGLLGQPCIDFALAVWPFPLEEPTRQSLISLGYELDPDFVGIPEQRFRHTSGAFRLYLVDAGSSLWMDFVILREYLRHNEAARQALSARKQEWKDRTDSDAYRDAKRQWFEQLRVEAQLWWIKRTGFTPIQQVAEELQGLPCPWYICGGWSIDLYLGRVTRVHDDRDVQIARADQLALREYLLARDWKLLTPLNGRLEHWPPHMRLESPRHQVHAHRQSAFIDFLLTDFDAGTWRYRREPIILRDSRRMGLRSEEGIPFIAPELALLFKSRTSSGVERSKDQDDFEKVYDKLEPERRAWLRWALIAVDPSHRWLERL